MDVRSRWCVCRGCGQEPCEWTHRCTSCTAAVRRNQLHRLGADPLVTAAETSSLRAPHRRGSSTVSAGSPAREPHVLEQSDSPCPHDVIGSSFNIQYEYFIINHAYLRSSVLSSSYPKLHPTENIVSVCMPPLLHSSGSSKIAVATREQDAQGSPIRSSIGSINKSSKHTTDRGAWYSRKVIMNTKRQTPSMHRAKRIRELIASNHVALHGKRSKRSKRSTLLLLLYIFLQILSPKHSFGFVHGSSHHGGCTTSLVPITQKHS